MKVICTILLLQIFHIQRVVYASAAKDQLLVVSIATDETEGYQRFVHSLKYFDINYKIFGLGEEWRGGEMMTSLGGGQKINILKEALSQYKDQNDLIIMFTDSYDVIFNGGTDEILEKFKAFNARIVFSAEGTIWPDSSLKDKYPVVETGKRFLCSGGIIGYAPVFWKTINQWDVQDNDDDQLYYTKVYLNEETRNDLNATLDHRSEIFQNINFAKDEISMEIVGDITRVKNTKYNTMPVVIHGNGPSKIYLNYISNYAPDGWHPEQDCRNCHQNPLEIDYEDQDTVPHVVIAIFVEQPTPFLSEFFERVTKLDYPKSRITLFIHNSEQTHVKLIAKFLMEKRIIYKGSYAIHPSDNIDEWTARNSAIDHCLSVKCDYILTVDSMVQVTEPKTLKILMAKNKDVIAPLMSRNGELWSNFWGALNIDGYYARSEDYLDIVNRVKIGIWNVPFISSMYLVKASMLERLMKRNVVKPFINGVLDADMAFCESLRSNYVFMFVTNEVQFGRLLDTDGFRANEMHPDMWQIKSNKLDWEEKYIHPDFFQYTEPNTEVKQPCPDAFVFPLLSEKMCNHLIDTANDYDAWSSGKNEDPRIAGGYENVPTVDIHMNQINYEKEWLHLLSYYATKMVEKVYPGYYSKAHSSMMFIVRYKPSEQAFLRPHHDSSTWTVNIALNTAGKDYEGGGCRFLRYNCTIKDQPMGWATIHPGRLTHYHEGLYTTNGTRYIFVSFVDP